MPNWWLLLWIYLAGYGVTLIVVTICMDAVSEDPPEAQGRVAIVSAALWPITWTLVIWALIRALVALLSGKDEK